MMSTIVKENLISFKELEKIFAYVCERAREITVQMLENYDKELAEGRDKKRYRCKGKRQTSIKTVYGEVEYQRNVYRIGTEGSPAEHVFLLDRYHICQEILRKISHKEAQAETRRLFEEEKIDEMLEYIEIYAASVESPDERDKSSRKARELNQYLNNNKEGLLPYQKRGIKIPELREGVHYKGMGVQENQNCTVITMRMKGGRKRWSEGGANNMAKLLYRKENKELSQTVNRYAEELVFNVRMADVIASLSATKAPKKDGKGNPYVDVINMHVPLRDAVQTLARKALVKALL